MRPVVITVILGLCLAAAVVVWLLVRDRRAAPAARATAADPVTHDLRRRLLTGTADELGMPGDADPWGVLMERGFDRGAATLVALATGDASIYLTGGGGVIGGGGHENIRAAARQAVREAASRLDQMSVTTVFPYPGPGRVRFHVLTRHGVVTAEAGESEIQAPQHPLHSLYDASHDVITGLREVSEAPRGPDGRSP